MNITYKEIANYINKGEQAVKMYKSRNPMQLEILQKGSLMKKYNIDIDDLKNCLEIKELLDDTKISTKQLKDLLTAVKGCKDDK